MPNRKEEIREKGEEQKNLEERRLNRVKKFK